MIPNRKYSATLIFVFFALTIFFTGCTADNATGKVVQEEPIRIGAILPLSGSFAYLGEEVRNSMDLAVQDINSANQKQIEIIYEDSKMDSKEGVSALNKLKNIDNIKYVIVWGTPVISAVQPITEENSIILIGGSVSPSILSGKNYTLRIFYNLEQALDKFIEIINARQYEKIAALYQVGPAWEQQIQGLEQRGMRFATKEAYNKDEKDFKTMLLKIKETKPDVIILLGYGSNFQLILKQIKELGMQNIPLLGGLDFIDIPREDLKENSDLYENALFIAPEFSVSPNQKSMNFIERFNQTFKTKPTHQAAYAYDAVSLIYKAITSTNREQKNVVSFIKNSKEYKGIVGRVELLPNGDSRGDLVIAKYSAGQVTLYKELT